MDVLALTGLQVDRGGFSLMVPAARFDTPMTAVLGPSGSGKSTLLSAIAGLARPEAGRVTLGDEVLSDAGDGTWVPPWRRRVGVVFQEPRLWPHKRVGPTIRYGGRFREADIVAWCGLEDLLDRYPRELSGGQAQRVSIARALMAGPRLLLLDEPFTGVDPPRRRRLRELLRRVQAELDVAVLTVTHHVYEALELTDQLLLLDQGRLVAKGDVAEVLATPGALALADGMGLENLLSVEITGHAGSVTEAALGPHTLTLPRTSLPVGAAGRVAIRPEEVLLSRGRLERVSARNGLPGRVAAITEVDDRLLIHVDVGQPLRVEVTRGAARALELAAGVSVWAYAKARAFRWRA
ncbi:MAG: hypothetical protein CSA66_04675 [Proteobacteria bacterium]|nr:MAG: hypothetical protein CSA66_04675 [Pseudomonadota bacterium]